MFARVALMSAAALFFPRPLECGAAVDYWDPNGASGIGGTGTWASQTTQIFSSSASGSATRTAAGTSDGTFFGGVSGTITIGASIMVGSLEFNTTGYSLTTSGTKTVPLTGPITLDNNVLLNLSPSLTAALTISSISGSTLSSLSISGSVANPTDAVRVNLTSGATIANSAPITIATAGSNGIAGFVSNSGTANINATVANNTSVLTMLGATSGDTLNVNGIVAGSSGVQFSSGNSGGAGLITLNAANTYSGASLFNGATSGTVQLGVANGLSTSSAIVMGYSSGNGQNLDLHGFNQTVASLASNGGTGSIIDLASGNATDTLTINGSAATTFGLPISNGITRSVALTRSGTGTTTLTGANSYAGPTTITGGALFLNGSTASASIVTVGDGANASSGALAGNGTVGGIVIVQNGGTLGAGSSATTVGTLTTGAETWNSGGTFNSKVTSITSNGSGNDLLSLSGLSVSAGFTINLIGAGSPTFTNTNATATQNNSPAAGSFIVLAKDTLPSGGQNQNRIQSLLSSLTFVTSGITTASTTDTIQLDTLSDGGGFDVVAEDTAAPEPTSFLLLGVVATPLLLSRRRRVAI